MNRVLLALLSSTLFAQEPANAIARNDAALRAAAAGAIERVKRGAARWEPVLVAAPAPSSQCAVPLRTMPIESQRSFTGRLVQTPPAEPMPRVPVPAPPCAP